MASESDAEKAASSAARSADVPGETDLPTVEMHDFSYQQFGNDARTGSGTAPIRLSVARLVIGLTIAVLSVLLLVFIVLYALAPTAWTAAQQRNLCTNEACISASALLQRSVDLSADPCQDFYSFACGGFEKNHPFTAETVYENVKEKNLIDGNLFELMYFKNLSLSVDASVSELFQTVRRFYATCMHWHGSTRLWSERKDLLPQNWTSGGPGFDVKSLATPLIQFIEGFTGPEDFLARLVTSGTSGLLKLQPSLTPADVLDMESRGRRWLPLNFMDFQLDGFRIQAANLYVLQGQINDLCSLVELNLTSSVEQLFGAVIEIANISTLTPSQKPASVRELQNTTDQLAKGLQFNWTQFVNKLSENSGIQFSDTTEIYIGKFAQLLQVLQMLQPELRDRKGPLYDFIRLDAVMSGRNFLPNDRFWALKAMYKWTKYLVNPHEGGRGVAEYSSICMEMAVSAMPPVALEVFRSAYVNDNFATVEEAVSTVRQAMRDNVDGQTWIDQKSKLSITQKLNAIHSIVAYPQFKMSEFKEAYSKLADRVRRCRTFGDIILAFKDAHLKKVYWFITTNEPVWKASEVFTGALDVNAHYTQSFNTIFIFLGLLRTHIYNKDIPEYLLYGGVGRVIGHEFGHAFDFAGALGGGAQSSLFDGASEQEYRNRTQCLVQSYDQLIETQVGGFGKKMGNQTVTENFADIVGVNAAFRAYRASVARSLMSGRSPQLLPGQLLSALTPDQLFFIQDAQFDCTKAERQKLLDVFGNDVHSPSRPRVNGKALHSNDFARVFSCRSGDPMYLSDDSKCHFW